MELKGKIVDFLGDSITEGHGLTNANDRYDNVMLREYGLGEVHNYGIGGTRIAHQIKPSIFPRHDLCFCGRMYDICPDADIIVVYGGVNDYIHGDAPIGDLLTDKTPITFCGGVNFLMQTLPKRYPNATVVFMTPARAFVWNSPDTEVSRSSNKAPDAKPLKYYVDIIKQAGINNGIPVLDLYNGLGINPNNPEEAEKYTCDGLHFNAEGHKAIAKKLGEFLLSL